MKYTNENFTTMTVITLCYHTEFHASDVPMSITMLSSSSLRKPFPPADSGWQTQYMIIIIDAYILLK